MTGWQPLIVATLLASSPVAVLASDQCDRLFTETQESATCATLLDLRGENVSDEELRELVSQQVHGLSWTEAEKRRQKRREDEEIAARESAERQTKSQCGRLFTDAFERDVCLWDSANTFRERADEEVRGSVSQHIERMKSDRVLLEHVIASARKLRRDQVQDRVYEKQAERRVVEAAEEKVRQARAAEEAAAIDSAAKLEKCSTLFTDPFQRDVCLWDSTHRSRERADDEIRASVYEYVDQIKMDEILREQVIRSVRALRHDPVQDQIYDRQAEERRIAVEKEQARQARLARAQEAAARAKQAAAKAQLDLQLKAGPVGFALREWERGGFGTVMVVRFWLQNNTAATKRDFHIACRTSGASGTGLSRVENVLYQTLGPKDRAIFELSMGFIHSQSAAASCQLISWK